MEKLRRFVQIWEPGELGLQSRISKSDFEEYRTLKVLRQARRSHHVVYVLSLNRIFTLAESEYFARYVKDEL